MAIGLIVRPLDVAREDVQIKIIFLDDLRDDRRFGLRADKAELEYFRGREHFPDLLE